MKTIDRAAIRILNDEILAAAQAIAAKHGLEVKPGRAKYGMTNGSCTVEFATVSEDGVVQTKEADAYAQLCELFGLKFEWLNTEVMISGRPMTIVGLKSRSSKRPILVKDAQGKMFVVDADTILRMKDPMAWAAQRAATVKPRGF